MTTPADKPDPAPWAPPQAGTPDGPEAPHEAESPHGPGTPDGPEPHHEAGTPDGPQAPHEPQAPHWPQAPHGPHAPHGPGMSYGPGMPYPPHGPGVPPGPAAPGMSPYAAPGVSPYAGTAGRTGLGVGALVVGVVGLVFGVIPFLFWLGGIMGVLALVLGIVGHGRAHRGEATDRGQAVAGIVLGIVTIVVSATWLVVLVWASNAVDRVDERVGEKERASSAAPDAPGAGSGGTARPVPEPTEAAPATLAFGGTHTYEDGVKVTVSVPKPFRPDGFAAGYEKGDTALRVTITIVNGSDRPIDVTTALPDARDAEGAPASTIFDGSRATEMFRGTVLPGKQAKAGYAFSLPAGADDELHLELAPQLLAYDPVIWTGPVK
ncbi:DUF4190 domain-containing protein [Streptomyces sp. NPDC059534]|uniref:DUF4190 domain-containing protein n=1 Tax=Streptomyces sp. NPDC059534 TaxID=3346859 RepID=UPI00368BCBCD